MFKELYHLSSFSVRYGSVNILRKPFNYLLCMLIKSVYNAILKAH